MFLADFGAHDVQFEGFGGDYVFWAGSAQSEVEGASHASENQHTLARPRACLEDSHSGTSPVHARPVEAPTSRFDSRGCPVHRHPLDPVPKKR